ncbi:hypothetical protein SDC9_169157 [bioreactor metagenome]|uniref:Uncharacterized protein n=1 Tax=bioreactor metagenome TaxID=1076179 RepID=A0A645G4E6_9ZZZZ
MKRAELNAKAAAFAGEGIDFVAVVLESDGVKAAVLHTDTTGLAFILIDLRLWQTIKIGGFGSLALAVDQMQVGGIHVAIGIGTGPG